MLERRRKSGGRRRRTAGCSAASVAMNRTSVVGERLAILVRRGKERQKRGSDPWLGVSMTQSTAGSAVATAKRFRRPLHVNDSTVQKQRHAQDGRVT